MILELFCCLLLYRLSAAGKHKTRRRMIPLPNIELTPPRLIRLQAQLVDKTPCFILNGFQRFRIQGQVSLLEKFV